MQWNACDGNRPTDEGFAVRTLSRRHNKKKQMNKTTPKNTLLMCALLGVLVVGPALGATIRYRQSGDWTETAPDNNKPGWQNVSSVPTTADLGRINWGNNTVTLTTTETIGRLQVGVDEKGNLVIANGGSLTTVAGSGQNGDVTIGQGNNAAGTGTMTVESGGTLNVANILYHGNIANGTSEIFGTVNVGSHLWTGWTTDAIGTININDGGILNVSGQLGLNWQNNGAVGYVNVKDGGVLNLSQIHSEGNSIRGRSVLDISGTGVVTIPGDLTAVMSAYTNALKITAYGGLGTVGIDYNNTNLGKTTLFAIVGEVPLTETVWNPAANPSTTGKWNERANWTDSVRPGGITKVIFNVLGAIPCTVTDAAVASYVVMGENGPGGTLTVTSGGSLTCGADNASIIGYNSNALMVVDSGASVSFGGQLQIGLDPESDGMLVINGGTVSVAGMFDMGYQGGKGTVQIKGGTLNLSEWDDWYSIQGASVLDVSGTGRVVINGNHQESAEYFVSTGQITNSVGTNVVVDYNVVNVGKTTIYPAELYLPPAQVVWDPAANPSSSGLWNECDNWTGGLCPGNVTFVRFRVPDAIPCTVTNAALAGVVRMGDGGPGGTLIITNGGSLTAANAAEWNSVGYNNNALLIVEDGGLASFGHHLWVGYTAAADGTLIINGGTVSVGQMFGLGWNGGKGTAQINGGTLNLAQLSATESIKGDSVLNITGTGTVVINGNQLTPVGNYIAAGKITANGGPDVYYAYYPSTGKTMLGAVVLPPPPQSITAVSVSGGDVTITYQTTARNIYHIEGTPSLSSPAWTPVLGSTNTAAGSPVTFTFPASGDQTFYRTVSP